MFSSGSGSGFNLPQLCTISDGLHLRVHRVLVVGRGVDLLRLLGGQELHQLERIGLVRRMLGQRHARDVDVAAAIVGVGEQRLDGGAPFLLLGVLLVLGHQRHVVGVAERDIALAREDVARLLAVAAGGLLGQVGLHALEPRLGELLALVGDHGGDQGRIVDVLSGADAHLALPFRIGQLLVGDGVLLHALLGGVDHARAHGEREPVVGRIAELRRNGALEYARSPPAG